MQNIVMPTVEISPNSAEEKFPDLFGNQIPGD